MEPAATPGTVLAERYRLLRPLARGGMGSVWCAEHLTLSSEVAVKIIDPNVAQLELGLPRFLREARALAALHSPFIVQVIDFGSDGELVYLVMELLEGQTLGQRLKADGKLSTGETCRILGDVCKAMSHAHARGIVHRDLKPENIFLCDARREHVTKVLDFGIAKPAAALATANQGDTGSGAFLGTPSYMSPEQCRGQPVDRRSDLWSIGAIAYECLTGRRLFAGDVVGDVVVRICADALPLGPELDALPPAFRSWLFEAMAKDPAERHQTAAQQFAALSLALGAAGRAPLGVDSAETLTDGPSAPPVLAPAPHPGSAEPAPAEPVAPSPVSSTLAHGSLERAARRGDGRKRGQLGLVVAGLVALAAGVLALLISQRGTDYRAELPGPLPSALEPPTRVIAAALPAAPPIVRESADAGPPVAQPLVQHRTAESPGSPPARPAARPAKKPMPPAEIERLRKKR